MNSEHGVMCCFIGLIIIDSKTALGWNALSGKAILLEKFCIPSYLNSSDYSTGYGHQTVRTNWPL